ncbi:MAG: thioredoxin domain-containing protein [Dehalococcoidales bacterium]|nr:thioredoxin domain-containing protein [Dehalococcoidales bacterium]
MKNRLYCISVGLITAVILAAGALLWTGGTAVIGDIGDASAVWSLGSESAPVVIDLYPDFNCPVCLEKERYALQAYSAFQGKIRLICHHYPMQPLSEKVCAALEAAGEQGKFWEMHHALINEDPADIAVVLSTAAGRVENLDEFADEYLNDAAESIGLDLDAFQQTLNDESVYEQIREAKQRAVDRGVKTASLFINGREYVSGHGTFAEFAALIEAELERQGTDAAE